jgi:hypothetical protein
MKKVIQFIIIALLASSCVSIKQSDFHQIPKNSVLLPALETRFDLYSFESAYSLGTTSGSSVGYGTAVSNSSAIVISGGTSIHSRDPRIQDAITIFDRNVKENITNPYGEKKGYIVCKMADGSSKLSIGLVVLSGLTLCIPNLFGMPFGSYKTYLDVEVEIYNMRDELIGRYSEICSEKAWMACYWGYSDKNASIKSAVDAFSCALSSINDQIVDDADRLNHELSK